MPSLRVTPMPADANFHGDIFGGWIMALMDASASMTAACGESIVDALTLAGTPLT